MNGYSINERICVNQGVEKLFVGISEDLFRSDISSTEIRESK